MPLWEMPVLDMWKSIGTKATDIWVDNEQLFRKVTALLFIMSLPWLFAGFFDVYHCNHRLWIMTSLTFFVIVSLVGFAAYGIIEARYRQMILPFWLSACAAGHFHGRPKRYLFPSIGIVVIGFIVYLIPKGL